MKIAFATTDGVNVDEHFGRSGMFAIYEMAADGFEFIEYRKFSDGRDIQVEGTRGMGVEHESAVQNKVGRLSDCRIIYMQDIGAPSAARLSRYGIMPIKVKYEITIKDNLVKLYSTIKDSPPLWLRKALEA